MPEALAPPNQPALRLVLPVESERLIGAPVATKVSTVVDVMPAGADPERHPELVEQAHIWAPWYAQLLAEALDGRRSLESLSRWLDEWVLAEVSRRVRLQRRSRARGTSVPPTSVVSLRTQFSHPRVLEVAVHLHRGRRSAAWAFQLVRCGDRWRCTALALDPLQERNRSDHRP
jgi:hypothetical protein